MSDYDDPRSKMARLEGRNIERGPEPESRPSWEELLEDSGKLHGPNFTWWARNDIDTAIDMLEGIATWLPDESKPQSMDEFVDLVAWENPDDREAFLTAIESHLQGNQ